jgi:hypothetical protein
VEDLRLVIDVIGQANGIEFASMINYYYGMALHKNNQKKEASDILIKLSGNKTMWAAKAKLYLEQA